ncbi:TniQ family protein [Mesobacillus subterraneus]|uniref:TniQ family protein n=1 Tax=Mesobacillus subterraneus TaxID=285983 RepID=UPI00203C2E9F|nr:TniQ family protein [Mesobacillus subterraneus]MCM3574046.1 TniQ family protein [Mesobacillus subterraneus]
MGSLLLTTMPRQDETFTSFLLRTCQENEYESLSWITNLIGIDIRQLAKPNPNKFNLEPLAQLLRIDESVLWSLTFHNDIKFFESSGGPCSFKDHANTEYDKICPVCFERDPYVKKVWNLKINMGCPIHTLRLINKCPKCNKKISSIRSDINKCNCGFKLIHLPKIHLTDSEVLHSKIITNAFFGKSLYEVPGNSPINQLSYYSLTKLIHSFWYRINDGRNGIGINQINTENQKVFEQLIAVYNMFLNWPCNFKNTLNKSDSKTFIPNIKRDFYTKLSDPEFLVFIEEFRSYLEKEEKRPVIFRNFNTESKLMSLGNVIKLLNMGHPSINNLIKNGILVEYKQIHNDSFSTRSITIESINKFLEMKKYIVFKKELANSLGLTTKHINLFEENGWIKRIEIFSEKNDKKSYYDIRFADKLVSKLEKNIIMIPEEKSKEPTFISFSNFHNRAAVRGISFIELIEGLLNGAVNIYKVKGSKPFLSYYFELKEVLSYIKVYRYEKFLESKVSLRNVEVCEVLRLSPYQLTSWVRLGFLKNTEKNTFEYQELKAFVDQFVPLNELLKRYKTSYANIANALRKEGIHPVSGYTVNEGAGYLFKRTELDKHNLGIPKINLKKRVLELISAENRCKL